jgi:small subunit ribosomal protein S16
MAVKLRMTRMGKRNRPFFRINAIDSRSPRDGKIIEKLGHYDPIEKDKSRQVVLNAERVKYWLSWRGKKKVSRRRKRNRLE